MITDEHRAFFSKKLIARLATHGKDGYPHLVPIWFDVEANDIIFISDRSAVKVQNVIEHPRGTVTIGGDIGDGGGFMIRGILSIEEDPDKAITKRMTYRYEEPAEAERMLELWKNDDIITLRLTPVKITKVF
jgi:general stress protein 26